MVIEKELINAGFTPSEVKIYTYLMENGLSTPAQAGKGTGITRTNTYHVFRSLLEKGLIDESIEHSRKAYTARSPISVLQAQDRKRETIERILPALNAMYKTQKNQPIIRFYDGVKGLMEIFDLTLEAKEILGIASTAKLFTLSPEFFKDYQQKLLRKKINFRDILSHESGKMAARNSQSALGTLYEYKLLPEEYGDMPNDILIFGDTIALMTLEAPVFGTTIKNAQLASTFRTLFEIIWKQASPAISYSRKDNRY